jgi:hypothetical protein
MSERKLDDVNEDMVAAIDSLKNRCDAVVLVAVRYPKHDDGLGRVEFIRKGRGSAYSLALRTLFSDIELQEIDEITLDDDD